MFFRKENTIRNNMETKPRKIDAVDISILGCVQAQPQKLGDISFITKTHIRTCKSRLDKLRRYGYTITPMFGYHAATKEGLNLLESRSVTVVSPDLQDAKLQGLIELLPTEPHKAFFRLLISGVIAKYVLFESFDDGYSAFIIGGKTKAFKTSIAKLICLLFGFDNGCIHKLFSASPGEFGIRRVSTGNGQFRPEPSQYFNEPFICLDELDKTTSADLKRVLLNYADGAREFPIEGVQITNHCTALITLNTNGDVDAIKSLGIPEAYIRRSVVLNTEQLIVQLKNVDLLAKAVFGYMSSRNAPRIELKTLKPRISKLSESDFFLMRGLFMNNIEDGYENLVDTPPLEILALGRVILVNGDIKEAIFQTVWDRLTCLETLGIVKEEWRRRLQGEWVKYQSIEQPGVMVKLKEASDNELAIAVTLEARRVELQQQRDAKTTNRQLFIEKRENAAGTLRNLIDALKKILKDPSYEREAKALLEQSKDLHDRIKRVNNPEELMGYLNFYNERVKDGKEIVDRYNAQASGQKINGDSSKPLEEYKGDIFDSTRFEVKDTDAQNINGWRVKLNSNILEIIKGNQRWSFLASVGRYKLGSTFCVFVQSVLHDPERIVLEAGRIQN